jgi:hypothetical protein
MSKFLKLVNENAPVGDNFIGVLKRMGVDVKKTDEGYIFSFLVKNDEEGDDNEEEAEDPYVASQTSDQAIDTNVRGLASQAGMIGKLSPFKLTAAAKANAAVKQRDALTTKMIDKFNQTTQRIQTALNQMR